MNTKASNNILTDLFGYSTDFAIDAAELAFFRDAIFQQWIARIDAIYPEHANAFRHNGLEYYHRLSHLVSHETLWPKENRLLPPALVAVLMSFNFAQRLRAELGSTCRIANTIFFSGAIPDYPGLCWRLVRPGIASDVGTLHADKWFNDIPIHGRLLFGDDEITVKMWLAIFTEPGLNGLYIVPGSHRKTWQIKYATSADGHRRPSLDEPLGDYAKQLVAIAPGQAVLFNEDLLHGGALNVGSTCRISIEMTIILKRSAIAR